jgi:hypothetical protein
MNPSPMDQTRVNSVIPDSVGALLAEEWTINPHSTLPSFLEMMMIDEARRSGWQALQSLMSQLEDRLSRLARETHGTPNLWSQIRAKVARFVAEKILRPYSPEIRFLIAYFMERRSLQSKSSATISEALYGGKRVQLEAEGPKSGNRQRRLLPMTKQDGVRLAFFTVLGHYLAERGDRMYKSLSAPGGGFFSLRVRKIFKVIYPFLYMSAQGIHLLQRWRYLLGQSVFFDPCSQWLNLVVRRVTAEDQKTNNSDMDTSAKLLAETSALSRLITNSKGFQKMALGLVSSSIAISWLARLRSTRQELRHWQAQPHPNQSANSRQTASTLPPPPAPAPVPTKTSSLTNGPATICPLCRQPRVHPTASTGGYVFCLKCLLASLKERPVCPISGKACPESSIVRLYEPRHM